MNRHFLITLSLAALAACVGCDSIKDKVTFNRDFYAAKALDPDCGELIRALAGDSAKRKASGEIDDYATLDTPGGVSIDLWVLHPRNGADPKTRPTMLILPGLGETKANYRDPAKRLAELGYHVVMLDLRAHGKSSGQYIGYGVPERDDVKYVMSKLIRRGWATAPIYIFGVTHGAATAIQYAAVEPRVHGILAMSPYADAESTCRRRLALDLPMMKESRFQEVFRRAQVMGQFTATEANTVEAVKKVKCPILFVHGWLDWLVPFEDSQRLYNEHPGPKQLKVVSAGPEQLILGAIFPLWVADNMDKMARTGMPPQADVQQPKTATPPAPAPAKQP